MDAAQLRAAQRTGPPRFATMLSSAATGNRAQNNFELEFGRSFLFRQI
jgi:hypothetical protein